MSRIELICCAVALVGMCMSLFLIPGSTMLLILSLALLSFIYFYFGFALFNDIPLTRIFKKESYAGISGMRIAGAIASGFALSWIVLGILYKIERWPGAGIMLNFGLMCAVLLAVVAAFHYNTHKTLFYEKLLKRLAGFGFVGMLFFFFSTSLFLEFKYRNYPEYVEAVKAWQRDPNNEALHIKMEEEEEKIRRDK